MQPTPEPTPPLPEPTGSQPSESQPLSPRSLSLLFGTLYFIQGISEPTEGLIAQPVRSLLASWGQTTQQMAAFAALVSLPWSIKPTYGLISDFLPLAGYRRKSYLVLTSLITAVCGVALYLVPLSADSVSLLMLLLVPATVAVAFSDVVIDALMVELGQPRGLTGRLQSVQWAMIYAASILTGWWGGWLCQRGWQQTGFLICGLMMLGTLVVTLLGVREPRAASVEREFWPTAHLLRRAVLSRRVLASGAFLFLWSFNPFSTTVQYVYATQSLGLSEEFYGVTLSLHAVGAMIGAASYGFYCRRVSMRTLVHLSIAMGVLSTAAYWGLADRPSAALVAIVSGFALITGTVIQLDLAAQVCPPHVAGTLFALLMALSNLGTSTSTWLGGGWYDTLRAGSGDHVAFDVMVAIGGGCTALCWLLVPWLTEKQSAPIAAE